MKTNAVRTKLIRDYFFTDNENNKIVGCVFDWFEVRVKGVPDLSILSRLYGYNAELDKGCATHLHYFETDDFSVSWDIKSSYIAKTWSHFRVKNEVFYRYEKRCSVVEFVINHCKNIFGCNEDDILVSRIDLAFDMPVGSFYHNILRDRFEGKDLGVDKYTEFHGKVGNFGFTNYSAGSRSARLFFRLYYKTIENTSYRDNKPKKQYIYDWHKMLFGNLEVVRFEVEFKPQGNFVLSECVYDMFSALWEKYAVGCVVDLYLGEGYAVDDDLRFLEKDVVKLVKLMRKFANANIVELHSEHRLISALQNDFANLLYYFNERL